MKKQKNHYLRLLNPRNLEKEVHVYGYNFSWKTHVLVTIFSLLGISAIGLLFQLKAANFSIIMFAMVLVLPIFIISTYKRMYEQKRFADVATYMEQMLYSFQKNGKVAAALKETRELFEDGQMGQLIDEAMGCINAGTAEGKWVLREALEIIEKPYACSKIHMVHELLLSNEEYGGEMEDAVQLLLTDIELWKRRGYRLQAEKKTSHTDNIISIIIATILCAVALYVLDAMSRMFPGTVEPGYIFRTGVIQVTSILFILGMIHVMVKSQRTLYVLDAMSRMFPGTVEPGYIFRTGVIQVTSILFILGMIHVMVKSQRTLTANWLQTESLFKEEYLLASYNTCRNYNEAKEKRKRMIHVMVKSQRTLTANWLQTESLFKEEYLLASYNTCRNYNEAKEKRKSLIFATPFLLGALTANWLQTESLFKEEYLLASYNTCRNYNEAKEKRKSLIFATPFLLGAVAAFFFQITWLGVLAVVIGAFMLMQHRVGYRLARKDVNAELYLSLPQWLMDMALLMQNNNVQVSIAKSVQEAPVILQQELNELLERLEAAPDRLKSYTDFCKDFDIPEAQTCMKMLHAISESGTGNAKVQIHNLVQRVQEMQNISDEIKDFDIPEAQTCMKMLHAISESGTGNAKVQIHNLVQRVQEMQNISDEIRNSSIAFKAKLLFSYPVMAATIKLLIDLSFGMLVMLEMLGNMGGM